MLFRVKIPASGVQSNSLTVHNPLDLNIMVLSATMLVSLNSALRRTSRAWSLFALSLPILGIPVFLATGTSGRSALLLSGLSISIAMLRSDTFRKAGAYIGIAASGLLFLGGDIATAIFHSSYAIAALIGVAYVLLVIWLLLVALKLFQLSDAQRRNPSQAETPPSETSNST